MELVLDRVAGLDVHQATVVATVRVPGPEGGRLAPIGTDLDREAPNFCRARFAPYPSASTPSFQPRPLPAAVPRR